MRLQEWDLQMDYECSDFLKMLYLAKLNTTALFSLYANSSTTLLLVQLHILSPLSFVYAGTYRFLYAYHSDCTLKALKLSGTKMKPFYRYTNAFKENLKELFCFKGYTSNNRLTIYS